MGVHKRAFKATSIIQISPNLQFAILFNYVPVCVNVLIKSSFQFTLMYVRTFFITIKSAVWSSYVTIDFINVILLLWCRRNIHRIRLQIKHCF
jgi:hypothetical protein